MQCGAPVPAPCAAPQAYPQQAPVMNTRSVDRKVFNEVEMVPVQRQRGTHICVFLCLCVCVYVCVCMCGWGLDCRVYKSVCQLLRCSARAPSFFFCFVLCLVFDGSTFFFAFSQLWRSSSASGSCPWRRS